MSHSELFNRAKWWLAQGVDLVPIRTGTKAIVSGYGMYSKHVTTEQQAWLWWEKLEVNLGVVCGGMIGLACIDFDEEASFQTWLSGSGQSLQTLIEQTARGYHVYFKHASPLRSTLPKIEAKSSGIVMTAPSRHPCGTIYKIVDDLPIAELSTEHVQAHFPFLVDAAPNNAQTTKPYSTERRALTKPDNADVISRIKAAHSVSEEATALTELKGKDGHYYGLCPFHDDHEPSFWVDDDTGLWGCYSPRCPSNAGGAKAHDVINLRMMSKHISVQKAIRELLSEME